jgi:hypothetical protein
MPPQLPSDLAGQLRRRREAALRLPPLACGCRDPLYCHCYEDRAQRRREARRELRRRYPELAQLLEDAYGDDAASEFIRSPTCSRCCPTTS